MGEQTLFEHHLRLEQKRLARHTDPATSQVAARKVKRTGRRKGQAAAILARLREGPATNVDLAGLALNYRARISDLRDAGYVIRVTVKVAGTSLNMYRLEGELV